MVEVYDTIVHIHHMSCVMLNTSKFHSITITAQNYELTFILYWMHSKGHTKIDTISGLIAVHKQ